MTTEPVHRSGTEPAHRLGTEPAHRSGTEPAHRSGTQPADVVHDPTSRWERRFCVGVFVAAAVVGVALVAAGEPLPSLVPVLLLAVLVALSVNLGALFPSEFSATADVALLFAAVVGFAIDAPLLGPFVVGLLMGPLDWVHWKQRLFYRMAYNSGSQSLCILLAALAVLAYVPLADAGSGWSIVCLAAVLVGTASIAWPLARFTDARAVAAVR